MDIKEYLERNLPSLNWNILPQLFEEEGIELTEEIVEYLKTTPWNTNWSVFNSVVSGTTEIKKIILQISSGIVVSSDFNSAQEIYEYCENHNHVEYNEYDEQQVIADGIEIYNSYVDSEQLIPLRTLVKSSDLPLWGTGYFGDGWSATWGVRKINNTYDYYSSIID